MRRNAATEFLGIDVGVVRVGIARGSSLARLAEPLKIVPAKVAIIEIKQLAKTNQADAVVVGLPRGLAGQETAQTQAVRAWVNLAKSQINLPFYWQDEALTTQAAQSRGVKNHTVDARAAAIMLQDFLDSKPEDRVKA